MVAPGSSTSSAESTIVVRSYVDPQPTRCCTRCRKVFPATSAYFKTFKTGGLAVTCHDCIARKAAAKKSKEQCAEQPALPETRGRKRKVLRSVDPNVQRKTPRLAPQELVRWDMASQGTKERMRSTAARERGNRYRRNNSLSTISSNSLGEDSPTFSSIPFPSRTPAPPTLAPPTPPSVPRQAPISDADWTNIRTFHEYLSKQEMETCVSLQGTLVSDGIIAWCLQRLLETGQVCAAGRALPVQPG